MSSYQALEGDQENGPAKTPSQGEEEKGEKGPLIDGAKENKNTGW